MITSFISSYIANLKDLLSGCSIISKYPATPMPYPLKKTVITIGVKSAQVSHSAISKAKSFTINSVFTLDISAKTAMDCYSTLDSLLPTLLNNKQIPAFDNVDIGEISFDSSTQVFTLPVFAKTKWALEEEEN